eukprot:Sspe_Gene.33632::Locus_16397_Transcript_1_1_Confidence_1.000_Length_5318::g.33632::m.33632
MVHSRRSHELFDKGSQCDHRAVHLVRRVQVGDWVCRSLVGSVVLGKVTAVGSTPQCNTLRLIAFERLAHMRIPSLAGRRAVTMTLPQKRSTDGGLYSFRSEERECVTVCTEKDMHIIRFGVLQVLPDVILMLILEYMVPRYPVTTITEFLEACPATISNAKWLAAAMCLPGPLLPCSKRMGRHRDFKDRDSHLSLLDELQGHWTVHHSAKPTPLLIAGDNDGFLRPCASGLVQRGKAWLLTVDSNTAVWSDGSVWYRKQPQRRNQRQMPVGRAVALHLFITQNTSQIQPIAAIPVNEGSLQQPGVEVIAEIKEALQFHSGILSVKGLKDKKLADVLPRMPLVEGTLIPKLCVYEKRALVVPVTIEDKTGDWRKLVDLLDAFNERQGDNDNDKVGEIEKQCAAVTATAEGLFLKADTLGRRVLEIACSARRPSPEVVRLISSHTKVFLTNSSRQSPVHHLLRHSRCPEAAVGCLEVLLREWNVVATSPHILLCQDASANTIFDTALQWQAKHPAVLEKLLEWYHSIVTPELRQQYAMPTIHRLMVCCGRDTDSIIACGASLAPDANLYTVDRMGLTYMHKSLLHRNFKVAKVLAGIEGMPARADWRGWTALHYLADVKGVHDQEEALAALPIDCDPLKPLLAVVDNTGRTPLLVAMRRRNWVFFRIAAAVYPEAFNALDCVGCCCLEHAAVSMDMSVLATALQCTSRKLIKEKHTQLIRSAITVNWEDGLRTLVSAAPLAGAGESVVHYATRLHRTAIRAYLVDELQLPATPEPEVAIPLRQPQPLTEKHLAIREATNGTPAQMMSRWDAVDLYRAFRLDRPLSALVVVAVALTARGCGDATYPDTMPDGDATALRWRRKLPYIFPDSLGELIGIAIPLGMAGLTAISCAFRAFTEHHWVKAARIASHRNDLIFSEDVVRYIPANVGTQIVNERVQSGDSLPAVCEFVSFAKLDTLIATARRGDYTVFKTVLTVLEEDGIDAEELHSQLLAAVLAAKKVDAELVTSVMGLSPNPGVDLNRIAGSKHRHAVKAAALDHCFKHSVRLNPTQVTKELVGRCAAYTPDGGHLAMAEHLLTSRDYNDVLLHFFRAGGDAAGLTLNSSFVTTAVADRLIPDSAILPFLDSSTLSDALAEALASRSTPGALEVLKTARACDRPGVLLPPALKTGNRWFLSTLLPLLPLSPGMLHPNLIRMVVERLCALSLASTLQHFLPRTGFDFTDSHDKESIASMCLMHGRFDMLLSLAELNVFNPPMADGYPPQGFLKSAVISGRFDSIVELGTLCRRHVGNWDFGEGVLAAIRLQCMDYLENLSTAVRADIQLRSTQSDIPTPCSFDPQHNLSLYLRAAQRGDARTCLALYPLVDRQSLFSKDLVVQVVERFIVRRAMLQPLMQLLQDPGFPRGEIVRGGSVWDTMVCRSSVALGDPNPVVDLLAYACMAASTEVVAGLLDSGSFSPLPLQPEMCCSAAKILRIMQAVHVRPTRCWAADARWSVAPCVTKEMHFGEVVARNTLSPRRTAVVFHGEAYPDYVSYLAQCSDSPVPRARIRSMQCHVERMVQGWTAEDRASLQLVIDMEREMPSAKYRATLTALCRKARRWKQPLNTKACTDSPVVVHNYRRRCFGPPMDFTLPEIVDEPCCFPVLDGPPHTVFNPSKDTGPPLDTAVGDCPVWDVLEGGVVAADPGDASQLDLRWYRRRWKVKARRLRSREFTPKEIACFQRWCAALQQSAALFGALVE